MMKLGEILEVQFAMLRVEFQHALLIGDRSKAKRIVTQLNQIVPTPIQLGEGKPVNISSKESTS